MTDETAKAVLIAAVFNRLAGNSDENVDKDISKNVAETKLGQAIEIVGNATYFAKDAYSNRTK